jgi:hypothetical protein
MFKFRLLLEPDRTLKKHIKLLTLYNNKPQHQETNAVTQMPCHATKFR